jgi:hypothetical protein
MIAAVRKRGGMELATVAQSLTAHPRLKQTGIKIEMFYRLGVVATFLALIVVTAFVLARAQWPQLDD